MDKIRYMQTDDRAFWYSLDNHLPEAEFIKKVQNRQGYVFLNDDSPVGLLRYNLFWDNTPFCTMLFVDSAFQRRGYGRKLMEHWENDMRAQGYGMVLTSTRADELSQHFYRKLGYADCGGLVIPIRGYEQPTELFFVKALS